MTPADHDNQTLSAEEALSLVTGGSTLFILIASVTLHLNLQTLQKRFGFSHV